MGHLGGAGLFVLGQFQLQHRAAAGPRPAPAGPDATTGTGKKGKNGGKNAARTAARVKITKVDAGSFTGTEAKGKAVTVVYGDDTKFGTKARPLSADQLQVGMTVTVAGTLAGDKITALLISEPMKKATPAPGGETSDSGASPDPSGVPSSASSSAPTISG
ncbi:hypothetical protein ACFQ9X_40710 [Catenulispora yoronensis]